MWCSFQSSLLLEVDRLFFFLAFIIIDYHFHLKMIRGDFPPSIHAFPCLNFVHNDGFCIGRKVFAAGG